MSSPGTEERGMLEGSFKVPTLTAGMGTMALTATFQRLEWPHINPRWLSPVLAAGTLMARLSVAQILQVAKAASVV